MRFKQPFRHLVKALCMVTLSLSLVITPQIALAANIIMHSGLRHFEMDLGSALLLVDDIDSSLQLTVTSEGSLNVSHFNAKKITLRIKNSPDIAKKSPTNTKSTLPNTFAIPLAFALQKGSVNQLIIERGETKDILQNITFNLVANSKTLALELAVAQSPWGKLNTALNIQNQKPFKVVGNIEVDKTAASSSNENGNVNATSMPYHLRAALSGSLQKLHFESDHALLQDTTKGDKTNPADAPLYIAPLNLAQANPLQTSLHASGNIGLEGDFPLDLQVSIKAFNAAYIHPQLAGSLNLNVLATGQLSPSSQLQVSVNSAESTLRGRALDLNATLALVNNQISELNLNARFAENTFTATGGLSAEMGITWQANLADISVLGDGFSGKFNAAGNIQKAAEHLIFSYNATAEQLKLPDALALDGLQAAGVFSTDETAPLTADISLTGLSQLDTKNTNETAKPIDAALKLNGSLQTHFLNIGIKNASSTEAPIGLNIDISGGLNAQGWQGSIEKLTSLDAKTIQLQAPAPVQFNPQTGFMLKDFLLKFNAGLFNIVSLEYNANAQKNAEQNDYLLKTTGQFTDIAVQDIQTYLFEAPERFSNTLMMDGRWDIAVNNVANANIAVWQTKGDLGLKDDFSLKDDSALKSEPDTNLATNKQLGLNSLKAELNIVNNKLTANLDINSKQGTINGNLDTQLSQINNSIGLARNAPLAMNLNADIKSLAFLPLPESLADADIDGKLQANITANGTLDSPHLTGTLNGNALKVAIPSLGLALNNGVLSSNFTDESLNLTALNFAGNTGTISATGTAIFGNTFAANSTLAPKLNLNLQADNFTALSRTDRYIVLSGKGNALYENDLLTLNGQFKVIKGLFELPKQDAPTLDNDVIVIGQTKPISKPLNMRIGALTISFGEQPALPFVEANQFMVRGSGLNGALSGDITLSGSPNEQLNATGSLGIIGTYLAYGQLLDIETGQINFSGPISNAGLNIIAMRNLQPTKAGVKISGTVLKPVVKLVSDPEVSESDKLSLLVIGQPMSAAGDSELALLSVAAGALLSQGDSVPLQTRIANTAGLDSVNVTGSDASTYSLSLGKRITNNVYLGYEKSLFGLLNVAKLTYKLTKRISVETRAGSESAIDLLYSFDFD